ncbi:MAG: DEAD/DEAH box helicase [Pseudomonas sp.]
MADASSNADTTTAMTVHQVLAGLRQVATYNRDHGDGFERLIKAYLLLDPQYRELFDGVWLWSEWPDREALGYKLPDTGIDLVARLRSGDGYCAIQCKFYESKIPLSDLGNFFTLSGKGGFSLRMIVATAPLSTHASDALPGQTIPVQLITLEDLAEAPIDWSQLNPAKPQELRKTAPWPPRAHQESARTDVIEGFKTHDRGKLLMACGTGKTFTALVISEATVPLGGTVLFMVPSIALLSQSLRAWTANATVPLRCFAVCSDSKASRDEEDMRIHELAYPATTNADRLAASIKDTHDPTRLTVIFSTYQSIEVVHKALKKAGVTVDLAISDEAHRTAGYTPPGEDHSVFQRIHNAEYIPARKRLYMTATPRIFAESSKAKAGEAGVQVFDMNDEAQFGPTFHQLRFDEAVRLDLLSDYKVLVIAVDELTVTEMLQKRLSDGADELNLDDAVKILGCWTGLGKHMSADDAGDVSTDPEPMRTALAFAKSIKHSKLLTGEFERISEEMGAALSYLPALESRHVDGTMNVVQRNNALTWLKENVAGEENVCRILTNARCLGEGVDVPALDAAIFLNPRDSVIDVVQAVGRVMRKAPGKKYGYVILPIGIRHDASPEQALDDNKKYKVVWQVLNALRAHDDRLDKQFATIDLSGKSNGVVNVIGVSGKKDRTDNFTQGLLQFGSLAMEGWEDALFAKIVHKCGNRRYWEDWAKDIATIAERHQMRINALLADDKSAASKEFEHFLKGLQRNLNPSIGQAEAVEMLAQHVITKPVFDALFEGYAFASSNPVSQSMQSIMDVLDAQALDKEHEILEGFYASVRERASGITDAAGRQRIILELYDKFFKTAFPRMVERLGIVYTPVPIVDFILRSADEALNKHFGARLADPNVHILDPFAGTGTFPVRLIESGLVSPAQLEHKYRHELHANEIVLLAYYIAAINIEEAYHRVTGSDYEPFPGIVLTDTFQLNEWDDQLDVGIPQNSERADNQRGQDIRVIVGNPPYSVGQDDANDNNQNLKYPVLDASIAATYAKHSKAQNKNSLYDSYMRAFRWASNRVGDEGIVCFVTNGGWIDANTMDGFRKSLGDEFSDVYVFNLRGNQRTTQGEESRREGGKIFDSGSRTPVAITLLVKHKDHAGPATIHYHDIGDYLTREQKLAIVEDFSSCSQVPWSEITPNIHHDWINQRSSGYSDLPSLAGAPDSIFATYSRGVETSRDAWVWNQGQAALTDNVRRMVDTYGTELDTHRKALLAVERTKEREQLAGQLVNKDSRKIKWTSSLLSELARNKSVAFDSSNVRSGLYRPFAKSWIYYDVQLNHRYKARLYPTASHDNLVICVLGTGESRPFSLLVTDLLPDIHLLHGGQCFPLYWYEKAVAANAQAGMFAADQKPDQDGYIRRDGITDVALAAFRSHYGDDAISNEDVFYYVYGVLHSPVYRDRYASDLRKVLPRVPYAPDFRAFETAGRDLAQLHLAYETVKPAELEETRKPQAKASDLDYYRVQKMRFGKGKDRSTIIYNANITLSGIPEGAYDYVINGKSAIDWVMERYQVKVDKDSGIRNDPNDWSREHDDPQYIYNLLRRVVTVSMETQRIVASLPDIDPA